MTFGRARKGEVVNYSEPDWDPLMRLIPEVVADFMWMHEVKLRDGTRIHAYKHSTTRRYVHLTADGEAWVYEEPDRYRRAKVFWAVTAPLRPLWSADHESTEAEREYQFALHGLYLERFLGPEDEPG
jgi:hypothetical protein